ncbi:MAG TPA: flagellar export chaperone FlgN [Candidatus Kapabacteria bacterium]|nr:flagellar export chaperone FlgN [Candidatus Kapabacteria bacterium]HRT67239.1 flagellar export chaperone FlgN [Bacteroidota bacterium]
MIEKILKIVELEKQFIIEMNDVLAKQQNALVHLQIGDLPELNSYQDEIAKKLKSLEATRINMIATMFNIPSSKAVAITMTDLAAMSDPKYAPLLKRLRDEMNALNMKYSNLANTNRMLANRAKNSFSQIISVLTNGNNQVYNVKV